jgi:hypothetical protein
MFFKFFSSIIGGIGKFIGKLVSFISKLLTVPGKLTTKLGGGLKTAAAANTLGLVAGVGTYEKGNERKQNKEMSDAILGSNIEPDFSDIKW